MTLLTNGRIFLGTGENDFAKDLRFADGKVVETGLLAYTKDAALIGGFEKNGTLVAGKNADFVIVDQDLFTIDHTEIKDTRVAETWVAGQRVYQRAVGEGN
ncbi:amidohydrolase family protein [Limosilactobacillus fermentum]|uniref:amidohydrolase family protein n=1 Tax=Limosilactobacillus fermentum TaxID=1613 RepID=UPI002F2635E9